MCPIEALNESRRTHSILKIYGSRLFARSTSQSFPAYFYGHGLRNSWGRRVISSVCSQQPDKSTFFGLDFISIILF